MIQLLRSVFQVDGLSVPVDYAIPPEEVTGVSGYQFAKPISVKGTFRNRAGIVTLTYTCSCTLDAVCDRCLKPLLLDYSFDFSHTVVPMLYGDERNYDSYLVAQNDSIDMNETALSDLLLMLPTKLLCREDCKGLCYICGHDLNESDCDCLK